MSAYLVNKETIDLLVRAALTFPSHGQAFRWVWRDAEGERHIRHMEQSAEATEQSKPGPVWTPADLGQELWDWNLRSITARYPDTKGAGEWLGGGESFKYTEPVPTGPLSIYAGLTPVHESPDPMAVLKCASCLEYQACEHEEWDTEEAYTILQEIKEAAVRMLPGWDAAPWGVETEKAVKS